MGGSAIIAQMRESENCGGRKEGGKGWQPSSHFRLNNAKVGAATVSLSKYPSQHSRYNDPISWQRCTMPAAQSSAKNRCETQAADDERVR